jgi:hypothetical protein
LLTDVILGALIVVAGLSIAAAEAAAATPSRMTHEPLRLNFTILSFSYAEFF